MPEITLQDMYSARKNISQITQKTPLIHSLWLSEIVGGSVRLKMECVQQTGSFKIRGAGNKILNLSKSELKRGVITVSSGNHGRAVSFVTRKLSSPAVVCVARTVPEVKLEAITKLGAELIVYGNTYDEALIHAYQLQEERGLTFVHPFDDPEIIAGQGTIGLELIEDYSEIDTVIVPLSGGGLLSGIGFVLKSLKPDINVVGVTMERGPAMVESLKSGRVVDIVEEPTLADALMGGIGHDNRYTFKIIQDYVDETVLVSEEEIAAAMVFALEKHHIVVEGGGAVGIAALLFDKVKKMGKNIAVILSGGNVDMQVLIKLAQGKYNYQTKF